jgi:recombination protein U
MACSVSAERMYERSRGKFFEEWVDKANAQYEAKGKAIITKIPTPWQVQRKYNAYRSTYEIANAYPTKKSTVDFGGTASNKSIWFDAKKVSTKTSFPLKNIHKHQIDYLEKVQSQGGKAFLLIYSEHLDRVWLLWVEQLINFIQTNKRKSIPFEWFDQHCPVIKSNNGIVLDYLPEVLKHEGT